MTKILSTLTPEELAILKRYRDGRDEAAFMVGVAALEYEQFKNKMTAKIDQSMVEEKTVIEGIVKHHKIDGQKMNFQINFETGDIVEI